MLLRLALLVLWVCISQIAIAQIKPKLALTHIDDDRIREYILEGDVVSIKTIKGQRNFHHKTIREISDSTVIIAGPDTIHLTNIQAITDKMLGLDHMKVGYQMYALGGAAVLAFVALNFAGEVAIVYAGQLLFGAFAIFAIPFAAVNHTIGLIRNNRTYKIGKTWAIVVVRGDASYSVPR